jgi:hypothetical protein
MVLVFLAIFFRRAALEFGGRQSASTAYEDFQIVPRPVVHLVRGLRTRWLRARLVCITFQQEVRQLFLLSDFKFVPNPRRQMGVLAAEDNHLPALLDALPYFLPPVSYKRCLHRVIADFKRAVLVFGLTD